MTDALSEVRHALHLDVDCPVCGAGFSQPCGSTSGTVRVRVHAARTRPAPVACWVQPELFAVDEVS
jgi:hypothetical protein